MRAQKGSFRGCMIKLLIGIFLLSTGAPAGLAGEIVHFYHNDHLGSPLAMTDEDGSVVWRRDYFPFGQEIDPGGETTFNTHTYTGKEFDVETGLYYYGERYYDPVIGRFISVDPAVGVPSNPQTWNRYVYTLNNPYKHADPDGEFEPWSLSVHETVDRINRESDAVGRDPNIGDILWFTSTEKGDTQAEQFAKDEKR